MSSLAGPLSRLLLALVPLACLAACRGAVVPGISECGNGRVETGEECDDGNSNDLDDCLANCRLAVCGDGVVRVDQERCDGNPVPNATCDEDCLYTCDDGFADCNGDPDDGCEASLQTAATCGRCGLSCEPGETCLGNVCVLVLTVADDFPNILVEQGDYVYWADGGRIRRIPKAGGDIEIIVEPHLTNADESFIVTADALYYLSRLGYGVYEVAPSGGSTKQIAATGVLEPRALTLSDGYVYWVGMDNALEISLAGVYRIDTNGTPPIETLYDDPSVSFAIAATSTHVYWASTAGITQLELATGDIQSFCGIEATGRRLTINEGWLYWIDLAPDSRGVYRGAFDCGVVECLACDVAQTPDRLAFDDNHIYWTNGASVQVVPKSGGEADTVVEGLERGRGIAADERYLFWISGNTIFRMRKNQ